MLKINHIALLVENLKETLNFYEELFDFKYEKEIEYEDSKVVFLQSMSDISFKLELIDLTNHQKREMNGSTYDHICFETTDFESFLKKLSNSEWIVEQPTVEINKFGARFLFISGINGENIQVLEVI